MTTITVNGEPVEMTVTSLVDLLKTYDVTADTTGVAVAVNSTLVIKDAWETTTIQAGDTIEIVKPFAGG